MRALEARPFLDSVQQDIASADDPTLRNWYETEVSLTPEYQEAVAIQGVLGAIHGAIGQLAEKRASQNHEIVTEDAEDQAETPDQTELDDYITPQESKRRSVVAVLGRYVESWSIEDETARQLPKASKRQKHEAFALRNFGRKFEKFGESEQHIVHDPEALATVIGELATSKPRLVEAVLANCEKYMQENGVEFAKDSAAFAKLLQFSTEESSGAQFDRIISAIYEKKDFILYPERAASLYVSLASASLESFEGKTYEFFVKVNSTASLRNSIIRNKSEYNAGVKAMLTTAPYIDELLPAAGDLWNARFVISQFRQAFVVNQEGEEPRNSSDAQLLSAGSNLGERYKLSEFYSKIKAESKQDRDFNDNPQHAEIFSVIDLDTLEQIPTNIATVSIPEKLKPHFYGSELYAKRKNRVAPRGLTHDLIRSSFAPAIGVPASEITIIDIPISPGMTVTFGANISREHTTESMKLILGSILNNHGDKLDVNLFGPSTHEEIGRFGRVKIDLSELGYPAAADVYIRQSVPEDFFKKDANHIALLTSLIQDMYLYDDIEVAEINHERKVAQLNEQRNHYIGRRPVRFVLPEKYQVRGLQAIELRQHPDRKHMYVSALHKEGRLDYIFDQDFKLHEHREYSGAHQPSGLALAFEDLAITLASEWICRPVVETSEGTVSVHEQKNRVNLGFLRYLKPGYNFRPKQAAIFAKEQRGDLLAESNRRRSLDPEGLDRNSTYVREQYDPSKPPLEVYYDPSHLRLG